MGRNGINDIDTTENSVDVEIENEIQGPLFDKSVETFFRCLKEVEEELYTNCIELLRISFILQLYQVKGLYQVTNKAFEIFMSMTHRTIPNGSRIVLKNIHEAKSIVKYLELQYNRIDSYHTGCILYLNQYENAKFCSTCGISKWLFDDAKKRRCIPAKYLGQFPLIPYLKRLLLCPKVFENMS